MKEIDFSSIEGILVGNAQNDKAKTGVTVFVFPDSAAGAVDVSGGGPASRETPVLDVDRADTPVNALVLGGGSAYGLEASSGVMDCLESFGIGYDTHAALVPIVVQSDIYDLSYGSSNIRPDKKMGEEACKAALSQCDKYKIDFTLLQKNAENTLVQGAKNGSFGGGTGATAGKICGMERSEKTGIGFAAVQCGNLKIGAAVVVNALGDIYAFDDITDGAAFSEAKIMKKIAGVLSEDKKSYSDCVQELYNLYETKTDKAYYIEEKTNTTIGAVFTNGNFSKAQLKKIASMTRAAYDRCIRPVGTMGDGDTVYAFSPGALNNGEKVNADINIAGTLAAEVMEKAIKNAVMGAKQQDFS